MMKIGPLFAAFLLASGAAGSAYWIKQSSQPPATGAVSGGGGRRGGPQAGAAPVGVAAVVKQTVPVYRDGIGNVQAMNAVVVRAQVDGRLMAIEFNEGQDVKKGAVLARIDPTTFKALFDQAVAKKAQDEANLANARIDLERYQKLARTNAGPKQQADQQAAQVAQLEAQANSDQAAIDNAQAVLGYTTITSPLEGRVGLRLVDPGNIVRASDANGIVSITQVKPISVLFTLPQRDLEATASALKRGNAVVEIPNVTGTGVDATGTLQSIDNQIDVTTGTIKLKASFPNEDLKLWPGQFVGVRVIVDQLVDVSVVPASAIRRGIDGNFVYTIGDDGKAHVTKVVVPLQNETIAVIKSGVDMGQSVVTEGFGQLADGKAVQIVGTPAGTPATTASGGATEPRRRGDGKGDGSDRGDGRKKGSTGGPAASAAPAADRPAVMPGVLQTAPGDRGTGTGKRERRKRDDATTSSPDAQPKDAKP